MTARIPLFARDGSIRTYAVVDIADAEWVNQWRWHLDLGYASRAEGGRKNKVHIRLHRALLGLVQGDGLEGDHINRNKLDCRRSNLRAVPKPGNRQNVPSRVGASSIYRGVFWSASRRKWIARIQVGGKSIHLGVFLDEAEAAARARLARDELLPYSVD